MKISETIWCTNPEEPDAPTRFQAYPWGMSEQGWVKVVDVEFIYEGPLPTRKDMIPKQAKLVERHALEWKALQDRIANLLAIGNDTHSATTPGDDDDIPF